MPIYQGTQYTRNFVFKRSSDQSVINVTGWTFRCSFRLTIEAATLLMDLTTANGGFVVVDGPNGIVQMAITEEQSEKLPVGRLHFDVLRTDVSPGPTWQFGGRIPVKMPVTRDD